MSDKWVEVEAKTIDDAIKAGLKELNLEDATEANISILREPEGGGALRPGHARLGGADQPVDGARRPHLLAGIPLARNRAR